MHVPAHRSVMPRAHRHDIYAERPLGAGAHGGDVGPELLVGAAERRQHTEPAGLAHGRHQLDAAAPLHGTLQDGIADGE
jgi:hypothetical protein